MFRAARLSASRSDVSSVRLTPGVNGTWPDAGLLAGRHDRQHRVAHPLGANVERGHHVRREAVGHASQAEQQVLGADVAVAQRPRLLLCEDHRLARPLCEPLKQGLSIPPAAVADKRLTLR